MANVFLCANTHTTTTFTCHKQQNTTQYKTRPQQQAGWLAGCVRSSQQKSPIVSFYVHVYEPQYRFARRAPATHFQSGFEFVVERNLNDTKQTKNQNEILNEIKKQKQNKNSFFVDLQKRFFLRLLFYSVSPIVTQCALLSVNVNNEVNIKRNVTLFS